MRLSLQYIHEGERRTYLWTCRSFWSWRTCACAGAEASGVGGLGSSDRRLRPDRRETCGAVAGGGPGGAPAGGGAQTRGGLERRPEGERPTRGDLLAADWRGSAGHRDAEPARESAGRRGRRRPEKRAAAGGEPAALEAERPRGWVLGLGAQGLGAMGFAAGTGSRGG